MNPIEVTAILGIVAALIGAYTAFRKLRPETDSIVITQAQGAATILSDLVRTLREEVDRCQAENSELRREITRLRAERVRP